MGWNGELLSNGYRVWEDGTQQKKKNIKTDQLVTIWIDLKTKCCLKWANYDMIPFVQSPKIGKSMLFRNTQYIWRKKKKSKRTITAGVSTVVVLLLGSRREIQFYRCTNLTFKVLKNRFLCLSSGHIGAYNYSWNCNVLCKSFVYIS